MSDLVKTVVLGIIQGLTEFLPVSSSGHLVLFGKILNLSGAGLFLDTMLHFGTLLAVFIIFWEDILYMIKRPFSRLTLLVVVGTIPTAIIGLLFKDFFEEVAQTGSIIGWDFLATGLILWVADAVKDKGLKNIDDIRFSDALVVGTLQGAAILPAVSRSGLTIAGSLFRGINREAAARFSFLLSIPAIMGAVVLQSVDLLQGTAETVGALSLVAGTLTAAICGYAAIKWMLRVIQRGTLKIFSVYVWILGLGILAAQFMGKF